MRCVFALLGLTALLGLEPAIGVPTSITANGFGTIVHSPFAGEYNIRGGKTAGTNLFHSFSTFDLGTGDTADFIVSGNIANILARVTGGPSTIDGTFTSTLGTNGPVSNANLFFINPAGVLFGPNAQINLNGAFVVTTASYAMLSDGTIFYADTNHAMADQGLTSAPVSAFGFLNPTPAPILFDGPYLVPGNGLHILGGDVVLDNGTAFLASSGLLTIFSAASTGVVPFTLATAGAGYGTAPFAQFGNITVRNGSTIQMAGSSGGRVVIRGGRLTVDNSTITSANTDSGPAADILLQADSIMIQDQGLVRSIVLAGGAGGNVTVQAGALTVQGTDDPSQFTGIDNSTQTSGQSGNINVTVTGGLNLTDGAAIGETTFGPGASGDMTIQAGSMVLDNAGFSNTVYGPGRAGLLKVTVTGALSMTGFGFIDGTTFGSGTAGDVMVHAGSLSIDGSAATPGNNPGIFAQAQSLTGTAGSVSVVVDGGLSIVASGEIDSSTFGSGQGGNVTVQAGTLVINGATSPTLTSISATSGQGASGHAGTVSVNVTGALLIISAGEITGSTRSSGQGGNVYVHAGTLTIDGSASPAFTGIVSSSNAGATGNAGSLVVNVDGALTLSGRGEIGSGSVTSGNSGDVTVTAGSLSIVGASGPGNPSGIDAQAIGTGNAGKLRVTIAGRLSIVGFGEIDTSTFSSGTAGDVIVQAGSISIEGQGAPANLSGILSTATGSSSGPAGSINIGAGSVSLVNGAVISSASLGTGPGGSVLITAGDVTLNGGSSVSASATRGDAGTVEIDAANTVSLLGASTITTSAGTNGGDITLKVGQLVYLLDSEVTAEAVDKGGNILIDPQFVVLDNSLISANAALGQGGNITILTNNFLNNNSFITATGTTNGTITISAPDLDLSGSLVPLPAALVSEENRLRERCARAVNHEFSTFIVVGRGGTETAPEELQPDFGFAESAP